MLSDAHKPFMQSVIMLNVVMLSVIVLNVVILSVIMLNVIILSVIMLNVVIWNVIMLSVVAPPQVRKSNKLNEQKNDSKNNRMRYKGTDAGSSWLPCWN
jgi:hypothetical protein